MDQYTLYRANLIRDNVQNHFCNNRYNRWNDCNDQPRHRPVYPDNQIQLVVGFMPYQITIQPAHQQPDFRLYR